jgi:hypothetical protein
MSRNRHKRVALFSAVLLAVVIAVPLGLTWRQVRQVRLNQALVAAVKRNDDQDVVTLLKQGADPNCRDEPPHQFSFWQVLMQVALRRKPPTNDTPTPLLIALKPVEGRDPGEKPTYYPENIALIKALLDHGADVNLSDPFDDSDPLDSAMAGDRVATVHLLLQRGAHAKGMCLVGLIGNYVCEQIIGDLLDHGADVNRRDENGDTPLIYAVGDDETGMVQFLLARHADVTLRGRGDRTPLMLASMVTDQWDRREIIRLLKAAGAKQ